MKKAQEFSVIVLMGIFLWQYGFYTIDEKSPFYALLYPMPFYVLVSFGAYSLCTIGWNLYTVRDCPEAHVELEMEIKKAKKELSQKGFKFE